MMKRSSIRQYCTSTPYNTSCEGSQFAGVRLMQTCILLWESDPSLGEYIRLREAPFYVRYFVRPGETSGVLFFGET